MGFKLPSLPIAGTWLSLWEWCSAQRIKMSMIAGGNHTEMNSWQRSCLRGRKRAVQEAGPYGFY